ncbi:TPA: hypothetical protein QH304_004113 [Klebsiella pneumoniae]|nr:hypothetical protein [Klebsiella pneumoniae]
MKKIFCITCHKISNALSITVEYLSTFSENTILIHVDKKSKIEGFYNLLHFNKDNVVFIPDRIDVTWGTYSQIQASLNLFNKALEYDFDYLFLLSGDDIPCMSNEQINVQLNTIGFYNLIHYQDGRNSFVDPISRVKYVYPDFFFLRNIGIKHRLYKRLFFLLKFLFVSKCFKRNGDKIDGYFKGTNWFGLNRETTIAMMLFINNNEWYRELYYKSCCADEVIFHTAIKHLGREDIFHDENYINDALRYIDWVSGPEYPKILNEEDVDKIKKSNCIFARKFPHDIASELFYKIIE